MPNHCYSASNNLDVSPSYYNWDWKTAWNPDVYHTTNILNSDFNTADAADSLMCDYTVTASTNMPSQSSITFNQGEDIEKAVGVTTGNMLIFNSLSTEDEPLDFLTSVDFSTDFNFDNCLSFIDSD